MRNIRFLRWMPAVVMLCMTNMLHGQTEIIDRFLLQSQDGKVYLRWRIAAGNTCDGTRVYRSTNYTDYTLVHELLGICGSTDSATTYDYTDTMPEQDKINIYKLVPGNTGYERTNSVFVLSAAGFALYPQPAAHNADVYFTNRDAAMATLTITDATGHTLFSYRSRSEHMSFDCGDWPAGIYYYQLRLNGAVRSGRMMVVH